MQFLNPGVLWALLPLAAAPLVIHLLSRLVRRKVAFSSIRELKKTASQQSKLFRWRHLLLLILRTLALVLIVIAFLRPVWEQFGSGVTRKQVRMVIIAVDQSLSMEHKHAGARARTRALMEARKIIATLDQDDLVNVVLVAGAPTAAFVEPSANHPAAERFVEAAGPAYGGADFDRANSLIGRMLGERAAAPEVFYLSDFQRSDWANVDFRALPPNARLYFVDVGQPEGGNRGILSAEFDRKTLRAGDRTILTTTIANYSPEPFDGLVRFQIDEESHIEQPAYVAPWSVAEVRLPLALGGSGQRRITVELPDDNLEEDNYFHLVAPIERQEEVLVITERANDGAGAAFFLETAINPFAETGGSFAPKVIATDELDPVMLSTTSKVFLTRAGELTKEQAVALADFSFAGGNVVWFLDGATDAANLARIDEATGGDAVPLQLGPRRTAENLGAETQQIIRGAFESPFLRLFRGEARQNLALLEIYDFYQAAPTGQGEVLLHFTDETPAMAAFHHGLGQWVLFNFSIDELSSNLARQRIFPAWVQDVARQLDRGKSEPAYHRIGETLTVAVWPRDLRFSQLTNPAGEPVKPRKDDLGNQVALAWEPDRIGYYTLNQAAGGSRIFAVAGDPAQSDLRPVAPNALPQTEASETADFLAGQANYEALVTGVPLFHYFVLGALLLLTVEAWSQLHFQTRTA